MQTPTPKEANGLRDLALQMRQSAMETDDKDYVSLFLNAAVALEERAALATSGSQYTSH